ncbi:hypothetical protein IWW51_003091 [Coemansia sp. RSA 2702]|nr:hypothetical protein IWW51_003091 [Coemansia sp. RSA 2702]KAJ2727505.1 hypothetical protein H4R23_003870 [Coemansia sp. Cherry 401B]
MPGSGSSRAEPGTLATRSSSRGSSRSFTQPRRAPSPQACWRAGCVQPPAAVAAELLRDEDDSRLVRPLERRIASTASARDHTPASASSMQCLVSPRPAESSASPSPSDSDTESDDEQLAGQGLYPPLALFQRQCLPESAWEPDEATATCRQCARRFTLFVRRHHCRRCGLVFCDACSSRRELLASPNSPAQGYYATQGDDDDDRPLAQAGAQRARSTYWRFREQRTCGPCAAAVGRLAAARVDSVALVVAELGSSDAAENAYNIFRMEAPASPPQQRRQSASSVRICPVCDRDWATVWAAMRREPGDGWQEAQERHIRECIEDTSAEMQGARALPAHRSRSIQTRPQADASAAGHVSASQPRHSAGLLGFFERAAEPSEPGSPSSEAHQPRHARSPMAVKYVAYKLNGDTPLLGQECAICFEDFGPGQQVARLNCMCTYHLVCISDWLQRTPACPVHYE